MFTLTSIKLKATHSNNVFSIGPCIKHFGRRHCVLETTACVPLKLMESLLVIKLSNFVEDMSGDLPSGWEERSSRSTGQTYFLNQVVNRSCCG